MDGLLLKPIERKQMQAFVTAIREGASIKEAMEFVLQDSAEPRYAALMNVQAGPFGSWRRPLLPGLEGANQLIFTFDPPGTLADHSA